MRLDHNPGCPLKTLFILPDLRGGGAQSVMLSLSAAVDRERFEPSLVVLGETKTFQDRIPASVPLTTGNHSRLRNSIPWLVRHVRRTKPDIIVSVMGYLNLTLLALKPLLPKKVRIIVREANVLDATTNELPAMLNGQYLYRRLYRRASAIVSPSDTIAAELRKALRRHDASITVIANPVDTSRIRRAAEQPRRAAGDGLRFVSAGRLTRQKGYDRLIELAPRLPENARIDIFGNGPDAGDLNQRILSLGLEQRVVIHDFTDKLAAWMAGADAFVLPSRWEGLPNVVLESLALGTPVIASDQAAVSTLSAEVEPGALSIAPVDRHFLDAMCRTATITSSAILPRASLLPDRYQITSVATAWNELLAGVGEIGAEKPRTSPAPGANVDGALTTKH